MTNAETEPFTLNLTRYKITQYILQKLYYLGDQQLEEIIDIVLREKCCKCKLVSPKDKNDDEFI